MDDYVLVDDDEIIIEDIEENGLIITSRIVKIELNEYLKHSIDELINSLKNLSNDEIDKRKQLFYINLKCNYNISEIEFMKITNEIENKINEVKKINDIDNLLKNLMID